MAQRTRLLVAVSCIAWLASDEDPRLVFTHFWGNADALTLARGLRAALDHTNVQR